MRLTFRRLRDRMEEFIPSTSRQDLIEYALTAGFVAVAAGATFPTTFVPSFSTLMSKIVGVLAVAATT